GASAVQGTRTSLSGDPTARAGPPDSLDGSFPLSGSRWPWSSRLHEAFFQVDRTFVEYPRAFVCGVVADGALAAHHFALIEDATALFGRPVERDRGLGEDEGARSREAF